MAGRQTLGEPTRRRQAIHEPTRPTTYRRLRTTARTDRHLTYKSALQSAVVSRSYPRRAHTSEREYLV